MSTPTEIGVGVVGIGVIGATHIRAYEAARAAGFGCKLVAACDGRVERLGGTVATSGNIHPASGERLFDPTAVFTTQEPAELLARPDVHLVSVCTHTESHVELAIRALRAGKHVLVEKPLAIRAADVVALVRESEAAAQRGLLCMPAMCMRYWPAWTWLRDRIRDRSFGPVHSAVFQRLGSPPTWALEFYSDPSRSGGAIIDLHVHDTDFVTWCFGAPQSVMSTGGTHHITTLYRYDDGPPHVIAEGGWDHTSGFSFCMRYVVAFQEATADFDLRRKPELVVARSGETTPIETGPLTGYDHEVRAMLGAIASGAAQAPTSIAEGYLVAQLLECEARSVRTRETQPFRPEQVKPSP